MRDRLDGMNKSIFAALAAGMLFTAAPAAANPPDCVSPDGTPCGVVDDNGVTGGIPGGMSGTAGPDIVEGQIPGGPSGVVTPNDVSGCIPGVGCLNIPR